MLQRPLTCLDGVADSQLATLNFGKAERVAWLAVNVLTLLRGERYAGWFPAASSRLRCRTVMLTMCPGSAQGYLYKKKCGNEKE